MNNLLFIFLFLMVVSLMTSCAQLLPQPTPTSVPTVTPTPTPALVDVAGLACQGKAIPSASKVTDSSEASYNIFIVNMDGSSNPWNRDLPQSLSAKGIDNLNVVLCVGAQEPDPNSFDCGTYKSANGDTVGLKRSRYLLNTRLVSASTGQTIFDEQVVGQMPDCPADFDTNDPHIIDSVLYGEDIGLKDVMDQQLPYFMPTAALIPMGKNLGMGGNNWDKGSLVEISPDARLLASVPITDQTVIEIWDVDTQTKKLSLEGHSSKIHFIGDIIFSPDGKHLVSLGRGAKSELFLWDIQSGRYIHNLLENKNETIYAGSFAFSPDGKKLAAVTSKGITVWDVASGQSLQLINMNVNGLSFIFTPDSTGLVTEDFSGNMKIWDVQTGIVKVDLGKHGYYSKLAFTSDGKLLKALNFPNNTDDQIQFQMLVIDMQTGTVMVETQPQSIPIEVSTFNSYIFDADHDLLINNHYWNQNGSLRVYDIKQGLLALELVSYPGLNGSGVTYPHGKYLPIIHWSGERYLLDTSWLYLLLPGD